MPDGPGPGAGAGGDRPYRRVDGGIVLRVHVQPGASRAGITGRHGDAVRLRVTAPPVDGKANEAVVAALAEAFGLKLSQVSLVAGLTGRAKRVRLDGVHDAEAERVLGQAGAL